MIGSYRPRRRGADLTRQYLRATLRGIAVRALQGLGDLLAPTDLAALAAAAGFNDGEVPIAVAIALAESGGDPGNIGDRDIGGSYGLWQIYLPKHPEFQGWNLLDPVQNARAAYSVYQREGWNAWTTYKSGKYRRYLSPAGTSATPADSGSPATATATPLTIDAATGQVIQDATPTPPTLAVTPGMALGIAAAAFGAYLLSDQL